MFSKQNVRKLLFCSILTWLASAAGTATAKEPWYVPENLLINTMGYQGVLAFGVQFQPIDWYGLDLSYGYSPSIITSHDIHSVTLRNRFFWADFQVAAKRLQPYFQVGFIGGISQDLFLILPDQYPESYYAPTALRGLLGLGLLVEISDQWSWSIDVNYLDSEIGPLVFHGKDVPLSEFGSIGLGIQYRLD